VALGRLFPLTLAAAGLVLALVALGLVLTHPAARALPPAGTDNVYVTADVSVASRIGTETIHVTGTATIVRQNPHLESGREVEDLQITLLDLHGTSMEGPVSVSQRFVVPSTGQIRSINLSPSQFPASSFFDVFFEAAIPASGFGSPSPFIVHNDVAIHLVAMSNVNSWPPYGVTYAMQPNAGPTPTPSPTPAASPPPGTPLCASGVLLLPGLPSEICVTAVSLTLSVPPTPTPSPTQTPTATPCVPTCTPTATPTVPLGTPAPTLTPAATPCVPTCTPTSTPTVPPATPTPIGVSGNDNFANAWQISGSPFSGTENTVGMTTEQGEPLTVAPGTLPPGYCIQTPPNHMGSTVWFRFSASLSGTVNVDTNNSDYDTVLAVYTGSALNSLALVACDDDTSAGVQARLSFSATAGTTYYIQAGGFAGAAGSLVLHVSGGGSQELTPTATPTPTPVELIGDVNKDGRVDAVDAALVLQYSAGLITSINPNADVNLNGQINSIDAQLILQFVAGLINHLPV
jgi:hypothetical protein